MPGVAGRRPYSDEEVEAAVQALTEPGRLDAAQRAVTAQAPQLQRILNQALDDADWFGPAHHAEVLRATSVEDPEARAAAVRTLIAEETRVVMLIGVAVGLELAQLLANPEVED
jgi:transposase-like protein